MEPLPCPKCRKPVEAVRIGPDWRIICADCEDCDVVGEPPRFVSYGPSGYGSTPDEAIEEWNDEVEVSNRLGSNARPR